MRLKNANGMLCVEAGGRRGSPEILDIDERRSDPVRPGTPLDWIAFVLLLVGAFAWGWFVTDVNVLDVVLERIRDPLDDTVFALIALSGVYWLVRVIGGSRERDRR